MTKKPLHSDSNPLQAQYDELLKKFQELQLERTKLFILAKDNGLLDDVEKISDTEAICVEQIRRLKDKSTSSEFCEADAKILDLLHKNLRMARGQTVEKENNKKTKAMTSEQLLRLVSEDIQ